MTRPEAAPLPRLAYTVAEVAASIGLSEDAVYDLCASRELPSRKVGRRVLIRRADLEQWLAKDVAS